MATLGVFREFFDNIRFHLTSSEPLNPATVVLTVRASDGVVTEIPMGPGVDDRFFSGTWFTEGRGIGTAQVVASAEDLQGNPAFAEGEVVLSSTYGRNFGEDYGDGY